MTERDASGKFVKGNKGGPGRPPRETEQYFIELFRSCVSDDDFREVVAIVLKLAKRGNIAAIKIILEYLMGLPKQKQEHTGADGGSVDIVLRWNDSDISGE